jgi:hypothetical protein
MGFAVRRVVGALALLVGLAVIGLLMLVAILALSGATLHVRGGAFRVVRDGVLGVGLAWIGSALLRVGPYHRRRWPPTSPVTTSPPSPASPGST